MYHPAQRSAAPLSTPPLPARPQIRLLAVNDEVAGYAHRVAADLRKQGIRAKVEGGASISKLVRNATAAKTPVMCIVGKKVRACARVCAHVCHVHCGQKGAQRLPACAAAAGARVGWGGACGREDNDCVWSHVPDPCPTYAGLLCTRTHAYPATLAPWATS